MRTIVTFSFVALTTLVSVPTLATPPTSATPPMVIISETSVTVSGLVPGGSTALIGVATIPKRLLPGGASYSTVLIDGDADGKVTFSLEKGVPWRSLWVAVDLAAGQYAAGTPDGFPKRAMQAPANLVRGNPGQMNRLWHELAVLHLLVVRPGEGAWTFYASKGGPGDDEKEHRPGFATSLEHFRPIVGQASPPRNFRHGDVVVALDPINLEYYAVTLGNVGE